MIKSFFTISFVLLFQLPLSAQEIPNSGFENWDGGTGEPIDWLTNNPLSGQGTVFQSLNSHSGMWSAALRVQSVGGFPLFPVLSAGADGMGIPVTQRYEALNGFYEFTPDTGDIFSVAVQMWSGGAQGTLIGSGVFISTIDPGNWTQFSAPINYSQPGIPDWCTIIFTVLTKGNILTTAVVDDLSFGSASSVEQIEGDPKNYNLSQNYPNPFNPTTNIEYSIPEASYVQLKIYDILGNEVATLVNEEQSAGTYRADFNGDGLASGLYIAQLTTANYTQTIKMSLLK
jgi:hypothetical protein